MPGLTLTTRATQSTQQAPVASFTSSQSTWITSFIPPSGGLFRSSWKHINQFKHFREEDYLTEVHHINGDGQDAGVVYSEMQVGQTKIMSNAKLEKKV